MSMSMTVLLQQTGTGFFVGENSALVLEEKEALDFGSSLVALDFCHKIGINDVEIVVKFSDPRFDYRLHIFQQLDMQERVRQFASHAERLACLHQEIQKRAARARETFAGIESLNAEAKERRKKYPFKPNHIRRSEWED